MSAKSSEKGSTKDWAKDEECDTCEALGALDKMRQISFAIKENKPTQKPTETQSKSQTINGNDMNNDLF